MACLSAPGSPISASTVRTRPPPSALAFVTVSSSDPLRSVLRRAASRPTTATSAPSATSRHAMACPMPRLAPVTMATLPSQVRGTSDLLGCRGHEPLPVSGTDSGSLVVGERQIEERLQRALGPCRLRTVGGLVLRVGVDAVEEAEVGAVENTIGTDRPEMGDEFVRRA